MMKFIFTLALILSLGTSAFSQNAALRLKHYNIEKKVALEGYDPVAYFVQKKAIEGKRGISTTYGGVAYFFSSETNKDLFVKNPTKYEPQYGGWCAYAMGAKGEKVEVDPETFKIVGGKLYVFYNAYFNNTLKTWNTDQANLNKKADLNWNKIYK